MSSIPMLLKLEHKVGSVKSHGKNDDKKYYVESEFNYFLLVH